MAQYDKKAIYALQSMARIIPDFNPIRYTIIADKSKDSDRDTLLKLKDNQTDLAYWLKSYQTDGERFFLPGIGNIDGVEIICGNNDVYIEKDLGDISLLEASLRDMISGQKLAKQLGNFYKTLHTAGLTYGDRLEDHTYYDTETGSAKFTDFGLISPYKPVISLLNRFNGKMIQYNRSKDRIRLNADPVDDLYDALNFLGRSCEEEHFIDLADAYIKTEADVKNCEKAMRQYAKYHG